MKFLIIGRTGTGKDTLARLLEKKGLTQVLSTTNRPKRHPEENTHRFVDDETVEKEKGEAVATTIINGYTYYGTRKAVEMADIYIIDPKGMYELVNNMPNTAFSVVYMQADLKDRKINAVKRSDNPIEEEMVFDKRAEAEDEQFTEFEAKLTEIMNNDNIADKTMLPINITSISVFDNEFDEKIGDLASELYRRYIKQRNLCEVIKVLHKKNFITDKNGEANIIDEDGSQISIDVYADLNLMEKESVAHLMDMYLMAMDSDISTLSDLRIDAAFT